MRDGLKRLKHSVSLKARECDHTRIIIDEAGGLPMDAAFISPALTNPLSLTMYTTIPAHPFPKAATTICSHSAKPRRNSKNWDWKSPSSPTAKSNPTCSPISRNSGMGSIPDLEANFEQYKKEGNPITPDYRMHERLLNSYLSVFREPSRSIFPNFTPLYKPAKKSTTSQQTHDRSLPHQSRHRGYRHPRAQRWRLGPRCWLNRQLPQSQKTLLRHQRSIRRSLCRHSPRQTQCLCRRIR